MPSLQRRQGSGIAPPSEKNANLHCVCALSEQHHHHQEKGVDAHRWSTPGHFCAMRAASATLWRGHSCQPFISLLPVLQSPPLAPQPHRGRRPSHAAGRSVFWAQRASWSQSVGLAVNHRQCGAQKWSATVPVVPPGTPWELLPSASFRCAAREPPPTSHVVP